MNQALASLLFFPLLNIFILIPSGYAEPPKEYGQVTSLIAEGRMEEAKQLIDRWEINHPEDQKLVSASRKLYEKATLEDDPKKRSNLVLEESSKILSAILKDTTDLLKSQETQTKLGSLSEISRATKFEDLVDSGDVQKTKEALESGYLIEEHKGVRSPIHMAAEKGNIQMVELLLSHGAAVNELSFGETPLLVAVSNNHLEVVNLLLSNGAGVNVTDFKNRTALEIATEKGLKEIAEALKNHGGVVLTPIPTPAPYSSGDPNQNLLEAIDHGDSAKVLEFLEHGADPNYQGSPLGLTPLELAATSGDANSLEALLSKGANPEIYRKFGQPPLILASSKGKVAAVKTLLIHKASPNSLGAMKSTALMQACDIENIEIVEMLIAAGADLNSRDLAGQTALMLAAAKGNKEIVKLLLARGATPTIRNIHGLTASEAARNSGFEELALELENSVH